MQAPDAHEWAFSRACYLRFMSKCIVFTGTSALAIAIETVWLAAEKATVMEPATPP